MTDRFWRKHFRRTMPVLPYVYKNIHVFICHWTHVYSTFKCITVCISFDLNSYPKTFRLSSSQGLLLQVCCKSSETDSCKRWDFVAAPITSHDDTSVTMDTSACTETIAALRYAWEETPCDFKQCAIYGRGNNLPAACFMKTAPFA